MRTKGQRVSCLRSVQSLQQAVQGDRRSDFSKRLRQRIPRCSDDVLIVDLSNLAGGDTGATSGAIASFAKGLPS